MGECLDGQQQWMRVLGYLILIDILRILFSSKS